MKRDAGKSAVLEQLLKTPIIEVACSKAGIGKTAFYEWKKADPEFASAVEESMKEGYEFVSDVAESQLVSLIKKGSFSAVAFWLKNNRGRYKTRMEIEGTVTTVHALSPERRALVLEAIRRAALALPDNIAISNSPEYQPIEINHGEPNANKQ